MQAIFELLWKQQRFKKSWLSVLQASGHIYLLEPYYRNIGKRLVKSPKIYFCDTGLAANLLGILNWEELDRSPYKGPLWETYAFNQVYKHYINRGQINPNIWFWRTGSGEEVDFIIEKGGRFIAIESKLTSNPRESDLKGIIAFARYYGQSNIIKSIIACKVNKPYSLSKDVLVSNCIECDMLD